MCILQVKDMTRAGRSGPSSSTIGARDKNKARMLFVRGVDVMDRGELLVCVCCDDVADG
jgi:hypothetical protein